MKKLDVSKNEREIIEDALKHWEDQALLPGEKVAELKGNLDDKGFEWGVLARYAMWIALASLILAVVSMFSDNYLETLVQQFYDTPNVVFCLFFAALAVMFYLWGFRNKKKYPDKTFSNETMMLAGSFSTAASIGFLGQILDRTENHYTILFLLSIVIYAVLSVKLSSKLIWVFTLVALGIWFATETAYHSNWGFKFWGMNYPLRFTIFGILLTAFAYFIQPRIKKLVYFQSTSFVVGLLYTMIALWLLSIFGNFSDYEQWLKVRQFQIFYWGLLGIGLSLALAIYGMKTKDHAARDIGFVFFILNLYTRFVEYLWDNINRTIFFLLIAVSFWFVGRWAEKVWKEGRL
ncbi:DUF2157 domain-containing protein [Sphingobacterium sp. 1.A.4]|uniref:DUF2157 domain-containing protein n=1 Tax=Sphingobacterium sp. 1.A.4 TaxID=2044603 RepID=UPI000C0BF296|nr:DUF2157 domain-containing protein [Sphingobacterium sp. 1.A.4]